MSTVKKDKKSSGSSKTQAMTPAKRTKLNTALAIASAAATALVIFVMFNVTQFSSFSKGKFILVNIIVLVLIGVMNFLVGRAILKHKQSFYIISLILVAALGVIGGYGTYAVVRINKNVSKITSTTTTSSVDASIVVYSADASAEPVSSVNELDGRTVGFATGTSVADIGKTNIDASGATVSYKEYQDYSSLLLGLISGEIDAAILPSNYASMFANESGISDFLAATRSIADYSDTVTVTNVSGSDKDITKEPFTVLLVGNADGLSDTMILCSVNPISMKVTMTSLARDSYVPISCYNGGYSKLNAAHAVSIDCTIQTIEDLIGVDIDYYIDTNFQGVVDVVNALGGIVVDSPVEFVGQNSSSERGSYTVWVPAGDDVLLNGEQALAFARERHLFASGDFARQAHQQEVIQAIVRTILRTRDINTFLNVLDAAGDNIQTNLAVNQMTSFMSYALQKVNRFYDQDHPENVFDIQGWRVTGYSSSLWSDATQSALYIYRLWDGSIADTREAIERNINMTSTITPMSSVQESVNWDFSKPSISSDVYNETIVQSDAPTTIGNYVGRSLSTLQAWADGFNIPVNVTYQESSTAAEGTILSQDVAEGTSIDSITAINVTVASASSATATPEAATSTAKLATPGVSASISGTTITASWGAVEHATSYSVSCGGQNQTVSGTSATFTVSSTGNYSVSVTAHADGYPSSDIGYSNTVNYTAPSQPSNSPDSSGNTDPGSGSTGSGSSSGTTDSGSGSGTTDSGSSSGSGTSDTGSGTSGGDSPSSSDTPTPTNSASSDPPTQSSENPG